MYWKYRYVKHKLTQKFLLQLYLAIQSNNPQSYCFPIGSLSHVCFSYIIPIHWASQFILNPDDGTNTSLETSVLNIDQTPGNHP